MHKVTSLPIQAGPELMLDITFVPDPSQHVLGVVWANDGVQEGHVLPSFACMQIDIDDHCATTPLRYDCSCERIGDLKLRYDLHEQAWRVVVIEDVQSFESTRLLLYTIHMDTIVPQPPPLVVDTVVDAFTTVGPLLSLEDETAETRILLLATAVDHIYTPDVYLIHVSKAEQHPLSVEFIDQAEKYLTRSNGEDCLLVTARPELGEFGGRVDRTFAESTYQWRFSLQGGKRSFTDLTWRYAPQRGIPVRDRASTDNDFDWLEVDADATSGPTNPLTGLSTFVIAMTMTDHFDYQAHGYSVEEEAKIMKKVGYLLCIDTSGNIVQQCQEPPGGQVSLCSSGIAVVGVNLVETHWQLWSWFPLTETRLQMLTRLDAQVIRASVVAAPVEKEDSRASFWLIEEYSDSLTITKRDASTLKEVSPPTKVNEVHLLTNQVLWQSLDRNKPQAIFPYKGTLVFLGRDSTDQLALYQVA
jgi:hypothetical protein